MGNRALLSDVAFDRVSGRPISGPTVTVRIPNTTTPIPQTIYAHDDDVDSVTKPNPFVAGSDGRILFYLNAPRKVDLYITKPGYSPVTVPANVLALTTSNFTVQDEGSPLPQEPTLDIRGDSAVADDHADTQSTRVTINHLATAVHSAAQPPATHPHAHADLTGSGIDDHHAQSHASRHAVAGADAVTPAAIGASDTGHTRAPGAHTHNHVDIGAVGINDHHARDHKAAHSTGGADALSATDIGAALAAHSHVGTSEVPPGAILPYGGTAEPAGWYLCDGAAKSRSGNASLFAAIGTTFGAGDGSTTFNLPDLRGKFPLGKAAAGTGSTLGETGGAIDHPHSPAAMNAAGGHTHVLSGVTSADAHSHNSGTFAANSHDHGNTDAGGSHTHSSGSYTAASHSHGSGGSHEHPYLASAGTGVAISRYGSAGSHTHSSSAPDVSGSSGSGGSHTHNIPAQAPGVSGSSSADTHSHTPGTLVNAALADHVHVQSPTAGANPPFLSLNYIIKA